MDFLLSLDVSLRPLLATFILGIVTFLLTVWYSIRKQRYWQNLGVPCAETYPIVGSVLEVFRKALHDIEVDRYKKLGRIYGHYEANSPVLTVGEPELLRKILVKDFHAFTGRRVMKLNDKVLDNTLSNLEGIEWKRVRTIITPTFTTGKIKRLLNIFKECSMTLVQNFREAAEKGNPIEAKTLYGAFTMDTIASSAFSTKLDSHNDPNNKFLKTARNIIVKKLTWRLVVFMMMPTLMKFFKVSVFNTRGIRFFYDVTTQIIEERRKTGQKRNDFLQLLMDTEEELSKENELDLNEEDEIVQNYGKEEGNQDIFKPTSFTKKTLTRDQMVAQCILFFLAGYDTTGSTMAFASYLLAVNPEIQERLIQELDRVLEENNGELTYDAIQSIKYLDNVISETLRLYPPAIRLERIADEDYKLGDTGLTIPKGMVLTIPTYAMHRDPEFFPEPEKFDPDRFNPEERGKRDQYTYLPFGSGPRNCVGMRFALIEIKVCLAMVLCHFRIKRCPETKVPLEFHGGIGLLQPKDILLQMEIRKDAVKVT